MARLVAVDAIGGSFVDELARAWERGDAVLPIDPRLPAPAAERIRTSLLGDGEVPDDTALVMATSGTTGDPKGVVHTHANVAASAAATSTFLGIDPAAHTWLACLPLAHVGGLSVVTRAWWAGTGLVVHDGFDAAAVDAAAAAGATHVSLVATALGRIDVTRWERIVLGGSRPPAVMPPNAHATYGLTETGSGVVYDGTPLPDVEVQAVDGELWLRGPMIAAHYRDGRAVTDADGWFHTGDAGAFVDGVVTVAGRRGDMIITGGQNVWPDPVEARLDAHPGVARSAVVGRPDPEWGQLVTAVIIPTTPTDPPALDDLRAWVKETLPAYAAPKALQYVDSLPTTALGKVRRTQL